MNNTSQHIARHIFSKWSWAMFTEETPLRSPPLLNGKHEGKQLRLISPTASQQFRRVRMASQTWTSPSQSHREPQCSNWSISDPMMDLHIKKRLITPFDMGPATPLWWIDLSSTRTVLTLYEYIWRHYAPRPEKDIRKWRNRTRKR